MDKQTAHDKLNELFDLLDGISRIVKPLADDGDDRYQPEMVVIRHAIKSAQDIINEVMPACGEAEVTA